MHALTSTHLLFSYLHPPALLLPPPTCSSLTSIQGLLTQGEQHLLQVDAFHQSYASMLGAEVCSRHQPAQQFSEVCVALENDWRGLLQRLKGSVEEMAAKVTQYDGVLCLLPLLNQTIGHIGRAK